MISRSLDATRARVRDTQVVYICADTVDSGGNAEGGQDVEGLGLEYREDAEQEEGWVDDDDVYDGEFGG